MVCRNDAGAVQSLSQLVSCDALEDAKGTVCIILVLLLFSLFWGAGVPERVGANSNRKCEDTIVILQMMSYVHLPSYRSCSN
jgi:hypothetical protein